MFKTRSICFYFLSLADMHIDTFADTNSIAEEFYNFTFACTTTNPVAASSAIGIVFQ
jgi:hypothetical protein